MRKKFKFGQWYDIKTLPDDLCDDHTKTEDKWSLRQAIFWNDCQGLWIDGIADTHLLIMQHGPQIVSHWMPAPPDPMTRIEILAKYGKDICPVCDVAKEAGSKCARPHDQQMQPQ